MSESTIRSFDSVKILQQFFDIMFGEQEGWAYTATKVPQEDGRGAWEKRFFQYPQQLEEMIEFLVVESAEKEIYYSPALFKTDRSTLWDPTENKQIPNTITKDDFLGTYFVWADFDGNLPDKEKLESVPEPTMKIMSSNNDRQHWYWRLNFFETDPNALEKITRALTYHLGADLSGWDYQQVLRPPGTIHHKSGGKTVTILEKDSNRTVPIQALMDIPEVPDYIWDVEINEGEVEDAVVPLMRHKIPDNDINFLRKKKIPNGKRSDAIMRVGYVCAEAGMTNTEIFSVLKMCDDRWQKFAPRGEETQKKNLISVIRRARKKYPVNIDTDEDDELPYFRWGEFASMSIKVDWIVDGLIQHQGQLVITGAGAVGKTHMTFQLACHMAVGKPYLKWTFNGPTTLAICSNELAPAETKEELVKIADTFSPEEQALLAKNLHVIPLGYRLPLDKVTAQDKLLRRIEQYHPEGIFFDSLGQSMDESPNSDSAVNTVFDFAKRRIGQNFGAFSWFIHHHRKGQVGNKKPKDPDDVYGSAYIYNNASAVLTMWKETPSSEVTHVIHNKVRFIKAPDDFKVKRIDPCGFEIISDTYEDLTIGGPDNDNFSFGGIDL